MLGTNRERIEHTVNKTWTNGVRWGWRHPPHIGEGRIRIRPHTSRNIPKISSTPLYTPRKSPYIKLTHAAAWKQTRDNL